METNKLETLTFHVQTHCKLWAYVAYSLDSEGKEIPCLGGVGNNGCGYMQ